MTNRRFKSLLIGSFKLALSLGLLIWFVKKGHLPLDELRQLLEPKTIGFGLLMTFGALFFASERWRCILKSQQLNAKIAATFRMTLIGVFFNNFMPGGVGGDVVKGYYLFQNLDTKRSRAVATVIYDRILGLFTWIFMACAASLIELEYFAASPVIKSFALIIGLLTLAFLILFFLLWSRKTVGLRTLILEKSQFSPWLARNLHRLDEFKLNKLQFLKILTLSVVAQLFTIGFFVGIASSLSFSSIPLGVFLVVVPMGFIATALPISPGGIGVGQVAFFFLFNKALGSVSQVGALTITAFQVFTQAFGLIGAGFYVFMRQHMPLHSQSTQEQSTQEVEPAKPMS